MKLTTQQELLSLKTITITDETCSIYLFHAIEKVPINISIVKGSETWWDTINKYRLKNRGEGIAKAMVSYVKDKAY